jgi:biopolymer transport protein TolR
MAMLAGKAAEMNVTPMIDILLVLIIIFMTIQGHYRGEEALIPQPPTNQPARSEPERTVVLELHAAQGAEPALALNRQPITWGELRERLFDIYRQRADRVLFIKADDTLEFAAVADAIDVAHTAYPDIKVGLITAKIASGS